MKQDLFQVKYDWDTGTWMVIVNAQPLGQFRVGGFPTEGEADSELLTLKAVLANAPNGDVLSALIRWEKGEK